MTHVQTSKILEVFGEHSKPGGALALADVGGKLEVIRLKSNPEDFLKLIRSLGKVKDEYE